MKTWSFIQPRSGDGNFVPPLGPLTLAAVIERAGWRVSYHDEQLATDPLGELLASDPDIVGISAVTGSANRGYALAAQVKQQRPATLVVMGGPHPSACPEDALDRPYVDLVVAGEGETAVRQLCDWHDAGADPAQLTAIPNLWYKAGGGLRHNPQAALLTGAELDQLPAPAFHLLDRELTFAHIRHGLHARGSRILPLMTSRGCPHQCTYCCRVMGETVRYRGNASLGREIRDMVQRYRLDEIWFEDDNFTANPTRAHEILDLVISQAPGIRIKFANGIRADGVDARLLEKMRRAGAYAVSFGLESGNPHTLQLMRKHLSLDAAAANIRLAKSLGFAVGANCLIGYPGETAADIRRSLDYFLALELDSMAVVNVIPFPGTELRRLCDERGYLTAAAADWDNYIFDIENPRVLIETPDLSAAAVRRELDAAYRRVYLQPRRMLKLLRTMSARDLVRGARVMLRKLF